MKYYSDGSVARYKARLVAQGYSQIPGIDLNEMFAPTVRRESLRIFLAVSALLGFLVEQMDIVRAYLKSLIGDDKLLIFIKVSSGMRDLRSVKVGLVCRLLRSIYGLKQSGRLWNQKVIRFLQTLGFKPLNADPSILISKRDGAILMITVYVDNFVLASNNLEVLQWIKSGISNEYNVKDLGEVRTIIGWQVTRDRIARTLKINQSSFIQDLIESEIMTDCYSVSIPMKAGCFIEMSKPGDYKEVDIKPYQRLNGKLMY